MKKLLVLLVLIYSFGCKNNVDPEETLTFIDKNNLSEVTQMFVPLAEVSWDFIKNNDSRNLIYSEIDKQFDGDNEVLFSKLIESENSALGRISKSETVQKAERALEAFATVDESGPVYPQIYIPFYEELKAAGKIGVQEPVIVFRDGPPTKDEKYQGYSLQNGELVNRGMISEQFASGNEV